MILSWETDQEEEERGERGGGYRKCSKNCLVGSRNVSSGIFIELYRAKTQTQERLRGGDRAREIMTLQRERDRDRKIERRRE